MTKFLWGAALAVLPFSALAQDDSVLVSDPDACQWMQEVHPEEYIMRVVSLGNAYALTSIAMSGPEVDCVFDRELTFDWANFNRQISAGYCVSSEHVSPTVFVIETVPELPGEVRIWQQGVDEPDVFYTCED
ncbi:hypothetical protein [Pelagovum pacificum]|uniref:Uncharacterized protein n=1 Tax=Pelagovum pacificum TaxID=2588711 RepID=A0A5C5GGZ2_9RHOB|nr:hypothetical protein [Pelagovum pacificum]QQA43350.1 hypothetical protein I8N54_01890 [Pelagovum pacificum]TNY33514.1 hypothetical protein FHY64_09635 [Pelagovum pacificum]